MNDLTKISNLFVLVLSTLYFTGCTADDEPEPAAIASFTSSTQNIKSGETVKFTSTSKNDTKLQWVFEGGSPSTSTSKTPSVTYNNAGNFSVTLVASNGSSSDTETKPSHITVTDPTPTASFSASAQNIRPGQSVTFSNNSENAVRFEWTFEGGDPSSSSSESPTVTYNTQGEFAVTLKAFNASGVEVTESKDNFIVVDEPNPTAAFSASKTKVAPGTTVSFTNSSTNATRYEWSFAGGSPSSSTSSSPSVTYNSVGTYTVTLKAFNAIDESDTEIKTSLIEVIPLPVADFTKSSSAIYENNSITYANSSSNGDSYKWTFNGGDPSTSTQASPGAVNYTTPGTYTTTLEVTNAVGTDSKSVTIIVYEAYWFDLKVQNYLYFPINIYKNGSYLGQIPARDNYTFTGINKAASISITWNLVEVGGIDLGAGWTITNPPSGETGLEVDNVIGDNTYQYIVYDNYEPYDLYATVNPGTADETTSGGYYVPAYASFTHLGYYKFVEINEQLHLHNNFDRTGSYWYFYYDANVLDDKSGRVDMKFDINGTWDSGTWNGSISREEKKIVVDGKYRSDWDIPLKMADFSNSRMIKEND
ncbi:MAG TPA: PKD domain-containing protein [Fulvivirga sp.]|nr:PKD domain-containing protein [Fulvivirga sp.]